MSCGHTVDPANLFDYCLFEINAGKDKITCPWSDDKDPNLTCGKKWRYDEIRKMALLTDDEKDYFEITLNENRMKNDPNIKKCKDCVGYIKKKDYTKRMKCNNCLIVEPQAAYYCFECWTPWPNVKMKECPKPLCGLVEGVNIDVEYKVICGKRVCSIDKCPNCGLLLEHCGNSYCKTLKCICGWRFCFLCKKGNLAEKFTTCKNFNGGCQD